MVAKRGQRSRRSHGTGERRRYQIHRSARSCAAHREQQKRKKEKKIKRASALPQTCRGGSPVREHPYEAPYRGCQGSGSLILMRLAICAASTAQQPCCRHRTRKQYLRRPLSSVARAPTQTLQPAYRVSYWRLGPVVGTIARASSHVILAVGG